MPKPIFFSVCQIPKVIGKSNVIIISEEKLLYVSKVLLAWLVYFLAIHYLILQKLFTLVTVLKASVIYNPFFHVLFCFMLLISCKKWVKIKDRQQGCERSVDNFTFNEDMQKLLFTAKRKLERLQFSTSSSFVKI